MLWIRRCFSAAAVTAATATASAARPATAAPWHAVHLPCRRLTCCTSSAALQSARPMAAAHDDPFAAAREALRHDSPLWTIQHLDITCDGCETEPIVGHRCRPNVVRCWVEGTA